jgi:hypothetical protein
MNIFDLLAVGKKLIQREIREITDFKGTDPGDGIEKNAGTRNSQTQEMLEEEQCSFVDQDADATNDAITDNADF